MAKEKRKVKLAVIRGDDLRGCPFGLPIPQACDNVGSSIHRMAPVESDENTEEQENIKKANKLVYVYHKNGKQCPYADKVLSEHNKVDCDFGDTGEGQSGAPFVGSPLYPQTFMGIGLDGLYGYPLGFYADNNESRNLFFGLFSFLGYKTTDEIIKLANEYDKKGEIEKADILDNLVKKVNSIKEEHPEIVEKIEEYLSKYRVKYENCRSDTGLLWDLSQKWYGPRGNR